LLRYRSQDLYPEEVSSLVQDTSWWNLTCCWRASLPQSDLTPADLESTFLSYLDTAHALRERYADRLSIPIGLETDSISLADPIGLDRLLQREWARIDYLVGSLHHVNEIPIDFDRPTFNRALASFLPSGYATPPSEAESTTAMTALLHAYFDSQLALLERNRPEVVGHFDLVRLWSPALRFRDYDGVWAKVQRNVAFAVGYGALFELNAAAFRKGWDEAYPASDVLEVSSPAGHPTVLNPNERWLPVLCSYLRAHDLSWSSSSTADFASRMTRMDLPPLGSTTAACGPTSAHATFAPSGISISTSRTNRYSQRQTCP
jgi:HisJ family histidinol phosphate phosphatase